MVTEQPHATNPAAQRKLDKAVGTARALILEQRGTALLVQDGKVYLEDAICAGCSKVGCWIVDDVDTWCPSCGGVALIHLDQTDLGDFENGLCQVGTSPVIHSVALPMGQHPLCMPGCKVGRMRPANKATDVTCERCIRARSGEAEYGVNLDSLAIPARPTRSVGSES